jgi:type IV fimbrial biogenesis protein FimT
MGESSPARQAAPRRLRGLTLLELVIALAVLGIMATLTLPALGSALQRHRLLAAAQTLAADLAEARFEAARSGQSLHLLARTGRDWCWAVGTQADCDCSTPLPC